MGRTRNCMVFSADSIPLAPISPERALVNILFKKTMYLIEAHPTKFIRTKDKVYPYPQIVGLVAYHQLPKHYYGPVSLNLWTLKRRDQNTCQYCGRKEGELKDKEFMNKDHIFPQDRGGEDIWENLVLSCNTCNNKKGNRTPQEAGMTLLREPTAPNRWQIYRSHLDRFMESTSVEPDEVDILDELGVLK